MTEQELLRYLRRATGRPLTLRINENRHSMVSVTPGRRETPMRASVHRMYLDAPKEVLAALAEFLVRPNARNRDMIRAYASTTENRNRRRRTTANLSLMRPEGEYYHLEPIGRRLNERFFGGRLKFHITWGRRSSASRRCRRQVTLGTCRAEERIIRINPVLDSPAVPKFFLEYVVYHEMAHLAVPARTCTSTGRNLHHTREFYEVERAFPRYREAIAWQEQNLRGLLSGRITPPRVRRQPARPPQTGKQLSLF